MMRRLLGLALIVIALGFAAGSAEAQTSKFAPTPSTNKYLTIVKGTYGFSFSGGSAITNAPDWFSTRASGTGVFYVDGKGNVVGGWVTCNQSTDEEDYSEQWDSPIIGGQYIVYADGTGFMYWQFNNSVQSPTPVGGGFCTSSLNTIEFSFSLVGNNTQMLFAADSYDDSDPYSYAGHWKVVSGNAFRNSSSFIVP